VLDEAEVPVDLCTDPFGAIEETVNPCGDVEAEEVCTEHPFDDGLWDRSRQMIEPLVAAERGVGEVEDHLIGPHLPQVAGGRVQMVVLEQHERIRLRHLVDRPREALVHGFVGIVPRVELGLAEALDPQLVPQAVVREPQHPVRDLVVVPSVGLRIDVEQVDRVAQFIGEPICYPRS
jgi:hypothetical protein